MVVHTFVTVNGCVAPF